MAETRVKKVWRISRAIFRWIRIFFLFAIFLAVFAIVYLHEIGVPGFIKQPILKKIQEAGFQVQFKNLRWSWPNHIRIENPGFSKTNDTALQISAADIELNLDLASARKKEIRLESFSITHGRFALPISETNPELLILTNIEAVIAISTKDTVHITSLSGQFDGAKVQMTADVTNYSALHSLEFFRPSKKGEDQSKTNSLQRFVDVWRKLKFTTPPELSITFSGDVTNANSIKVDIDLVTRARTQTPWGNADNLQLQGHYPGGIDGKAQSIAEFHTSADNVETVYGSGHKINCDIRLFSEPNSLWRSEIVLGLANLKANVTNSLVTNQVQATNFQWKGNFVCSTNWKPKSVTGQMQLLAVDSSSGSAQQLNIDLRLRHETNSNSINTSWEFSRPFSPWTAAWDIDLRDIKTAKLELEHLHCVGDWQAPTFSIQKLEATLYDGSLKFSGGVNVATRQSKANLISDLDIRKLLQALGLAEESSWKNYHWDRPPQVACEAEAVLPARWNDKIDWKKEVLPSLQLSGKVALKKNSYQDISILSTKTDFAFSNLTWRIPNLHLVRPEGVVDLNLTLNQRTGDHHWIVDSSIDPQALRSMFPKAAKKTFDKVLLSSPPGIHAEIFERDFHFQDSGIFADISLTNVAYGEIGLDRLQTSLTFSNNLLSFIDIKADQGEKRVRCAQAEIDFNTAKVSLHEVYSTMEPMPITRAIGRKVAAAIEPYQFHKTPTVYVEGSFVFDHPETGDMHFIVEGEDFEWGVLKAEKANGKVDWIGTNLYITNIDAQAFEGGQFEGSVAVNIRPHSGNDFQMAIGFTNVNFQAGLASIGKTNRLEGTLNGRVNLTAANTQDLNHWEGFGWMQLQNGFIWDVPIFGIFSPVLNTIVPGSGSSRAGEALATFVMTNSIVRSDDLEIRSPAVRVNYRGTVNFNQQVDAKVEAQILRDAGSLGHLFSIALQPLTKIFEYKLSGSLEDPRSEPVFIPKILMNILRPFHSLKKIIPEKAESVSEKDQKATGIKPPP